MQRCPELHWWLDNRELRYEYAEFCHDARSRIPRRQFDLVISEYPPRSKQIIAEVGPAAATFPSEKCLSSWVGACPGEEESAGVNYSHRSPKGNRHMRRLLNQTANAAVKAKGSIFEIIYRRCVRRASGIIKPLGSLRIDSVV